MNLFLDTSTGACKIYLYDNNNLIVQKTWQADRQLAKGLLGQLEQFLQENESSFTALKGLGVFRGPGSFTGLRIGVTILNTMADALDVPIVGGMGDEWREDVLRNLRNNQNDHIVLPEYGSLPHITQARK